MSKKQTLIENIVRNPVYMRDSGLVLNLVAALEKMSVSNLQALETVINLKNDKARGRVLPNHTGERMGRLILLSAHRMPRCVAGSGNNAASQTKERSDEIQDKTHKFCARQNQETRQR